MRRSILKPLRDSNLYDLKQKMETTLMKSTRPKDLLQGKTLKDGWILIEKLNKNSEAGDSGGNFGTGYIAKRGQDEMAFVKAIDFTAALKGNNTTEKLLMLVREFEFEREVMEYCTHAGMSKVLRFYGHDEVFADNSENPLMKVSCLIMEAGDKDLRRLVNTEGAGTAAGCAWNLYILSDVSQAVSQLHRGNIAHHDIKPSNIISTKSHYKTHDQDLAIAPTGALVARQQVKVGDLGRVQRRDQAGPFNGIAFSGDRRYSPPEVLYDHTPPDWIDSRESADAYMVGSLIFFLFTGVSLRDLIMSHVPEQFKPDKWRGKYDESLLAVLVDAKARVLHDYLKPALPVEFCHDIIEIAMQLTHPDPTKRGDPKARRQVGSVGMDRFHSRLQLMAKKCAAFERGRAKRK